MIYDPSNGRRYGAWCQFRDDELAILDTSMQAIADGGQPIAKCELAMLPILRYHERCKLAKRDIVWMVDNTAALGGVIKRASGLAVSEQLIVTCWMLAFALDLRLWIEYVDSKGNWSDGISRDFGDDQYSVHCCNPLAWYTADVQKAKENALTLRGK